MNQKQAFIKIRQMAKRGSNEMLKRAIDDVFMAGFEAGMKSLSDELKGRIVNDNQGTNTGDNPDRERGESNCTESIGCGGADANDGNRDPGSTIPAPNAE